MVVCAYFQQGRCKFGERCKYEHPGHITAGSSNRFSALQSSTGSSTSVAGRRANQLNNKFNTYGLHAEDIKYELTAGKGRPEWLFSAYGPGKNTPRQLFGGPQREQSFEEMRLRHYEAAAAGNINQALKEAQDLQEESLRQIYFILNDVEGAMKYVVEGENEHPNRIDIAEGKNLPKPSPVGNTLSVPPSAGQGQTPSSFSSMSTTSSPSVFGQPSPFTQPTAPLSAPPFGQPSRFGQPTATSTFGQQSGLGGGQAAFGQPSTLGQQGPAFGQPSGLGSQGPAIGRPSPLGGQPAFGKPAFGQPGFGQPSAPGFGQPTNMSPFNQLSAQNQGAPGGFGQPSGPATQPTAGPFGQPAGQQPAPAPSPFGQPAAPTGFGQPSAMQTTTTAGGFAQPSQTISPFAQVQQQQQQPINPFAQAQAQAQQGPGVGVGAAAANPFGQPPAAAPQAQAATTAKPPAAPAPRVGLGPKPLIRVADNELNPVPSDKLTGQTIRDPITNKLTMWKGRPVKYNAEGGYPCYLHPDDNKTWVHIFFPDGPPEQPTLKDVEAKPEEYTPEIAEQYQFFLQNGCWKDGVIPSVAPKVEWMGFDF